MILEFFLNLLDSPFLSGGEDPSHFEMAHFLYLKQDPKPNLCIQKGQWDHCRGELAVLTSSFGLFAKRAD